MTWDRHILLAEADQAGREFVARLERLQRLLGREDVSYEQACVLARRARGLTVARLAEEKEREAA